MEEIEFIEGMLVKLRGLKASIKKKDKLSQKAFDMDLASHTPNQIEKASVNLNWECMNLDKERTRFARAFKGSTLDVDTGEKIYKPSGFHTYKG